MTRATAHLYDGLRAARTVDPDYFQRECGVWDHVDERDEPCTCEDCSEEIA